jgi:ABC-2 type transport system ATP-binding protein
MDYAIETNGLGKSFNAVTALSDLDLKVPQNTIFGFLGPNGSGKTTTIRLLLGLLEPSGGEARVLGYSTQTQADQVRVRTGALLEHTGIYEQMTAEDNLEFYGRAFGMPPIDREKRIRELLTRMGLWERRKNRAGSWSLGMKQKLALARALLHKPRLLLLDEPTAGLDVQAAVAIRNDLEALASEGKVTIFLTTHNMVDAEKLCDRVAVIKEGKLLACGTPEDLQAQVGNQRVVITGRGFNEPATNLLANYPQVKAVASQNGNLVVELIKEMDVAPLVSALVGVGVQVEGVRLERASLEEVFLTLTGGRHV